jgi:hypothetical protein
MRFGMTDVPFSELRLSTEGERWERDQLFPIFALLVPQAALGLRGRRNYFAARNVSAGACGNLRRLAILANSTGSSPGSAGEAVGV